MYQLDIFNLYEWIMAHSTVIQIACHLGYLNIISSAVLTVEEFRFVSDEYSLFVQWPVYLHQRLQNTTRNTTSQRE